jgi:hypothetical protein
LIPDSSTNERIAHCESSEALPVGLAWDTAGGGVGCTGFVVPTCVFAAALSALTMGAADAVVVALAVGVAAGLAVGVGVGVAVAVVDPAELDFELIVMFV